MLSKRTLLQNPNNEPDNPDTMLSTLALSRFGIGAASLVAILGLSFMGGNCCGGSVDENDNPTVIEAGLISRAKREGKTVEEVAIEAAQKETAYGDASGRSARAILDAAERIQQRKGQK